MQGRKQRLPSRHCASTVRVGGGYHAFNFIGGVPRQIVPDNPKVGVVNANWYEPGLNPTYQDFATHYGTAIRKGRQPTWST